eukprot:TRINITY_DN23920_c1_g1_i1.p3 TRINITY_DN23920_c1_g1~~TRINITY_DN23920_c1_g1_i1.p3  ORF type:complete len:336 (+),score=83.93 TRINITY_DN23920_c1_g1_i1:1638-2645(+)
MRVQFAQGSGPRAREGALQLSSVAAVAEAALREAGGPESPALPARLFTSSAAAVLAAHVVLGALQIADVGAGLRGAFRTVLQRAEHAGAASLLGRDGPAVLLSTARTDCPTPPSDCGTSALDGAACVCIVELGGELTGDSPSSKDDLVLILVVALCAVGALLCCIVVALCWRHKRRRARPQSGGPSAKLPEATPGPEQLEPPARAAPPDPPPPAADIAPPPPPAPAQSHAPAPAPPPAAAPVAVQTEGAPGRYSGGLPPAEADPPTDTPTEDRPPWDASPVMQRAVSPSGVSPAFMRPLPAGQGFGASFDAVENSDEEGRADPPQWATWAQSPPQ